MKSVMDAHSMLEYAISRAALEGNVGSTTIHIPLTDITDAEGPQYTDDAADTMLKVTIITSWEDADDVQEIFQSNYEDEDKEGDFT